MIYSKQFVIAKKKYIADGFQCIKLTNDFILSYHEDLSVFMSDDKRIILLGDAWQVDPTYQSPIEEIRKLLQQKKGPLPMESILTMEETWCGRYVLIAEGNVFLDASGLLGVFYSADGGISSSCGLLAKVMGFQEQIFEAKEDCRWLPGPCTQYKEIKRILPSQIYNYWDQKSIPKNLLSSRQFSYRTESELAKIFADYFVNSLNNMVSMFADWEIYIALSGGYDSRTVVALAEYAGINYKCYTQEHESLTVGDTVIPKKVCSILHREHLYIERDSANYDSQKEKEYIRHTGGLANDADRLYYAYHQYDPLLGTKKKKVLLLRGHVWESVIEYYRTFISDKVDFKSIFNYFYADNYPLLKRSLEEYFRWLEKSAQPELNVCNRFFWEQRVGSWLSSIEQGFDLCENIKSFHPVNCRLLLSILLNYPKEKRIAKMHEADIVAYACPQIKDIEYDGDRKIMNETIIQMCQGVRKAFKRLKYMGFKETAKTYINILKAKNEIKKVQ